MTATTQTEALNAARANYYRFLRRFYFQEVDTPLWAQLRQMNIPADCPQPRMAEGYEMLRDFLARHDADILDELAAVAQENVVQPPDGVAVAGVGQHQNAPLIG